MQNQKQESNIVARYVAEDSKGNIRQSNILKHLCLIPDVQRQEKGSDKQNSLMSIIQKCQGQLQKRQIIQRLKQIGPIVTQVKFKIKKRQLQKKIEKNQSIVQEIDQVIVTLLQSVNQRHKLLMYKSKIQVRLKENSSVALGILQKYVKGKLSEYQSNRISKQVFPQVTEQIVFLSQVHNQLALLDIIKQIKIEKPKVIKQIKQVTIQKSKSKRISITPDTTTIAWKHNKYRQENENKKVCISQGVYPPEWLCSAQDLPCDGECVFTIKAIKIDKWMQNGKQYSSIHIGLMESKMKGEERDDTYHHCVYLDLYSQMIWRPNEEQTDFNGIDCSCQQFLSSLPCLIECNVNRNQNTITFQYNGKEQAKQKMPQSWKDGRKICVLACIWEKDDCVEFM